MGIEQEAWAAQPRPPISLLVRRGLTSKLRSVDLRPELMGLSNRFSRVMRPLPRAQPAPLAPLRYKFVAHARAAIGPLCTQGGEAVPHACGDTQKSLQTQPESDPFQFALRRGSAATASRSSFLVPMLIRLMPAPNSIAPGTFLMMQQHSFGNPPRKYGAA